VAQTEGDPTGQLAARLKEMLFTRERLASLIKEFHLYPDQVRRIGLLDAAEDMRKHHLKFQSSGGETFRISFEDEIPQQAAAVTARAAEMLLEVHRTWRTQDVVKTQQFFDAQKRAAEEVLRARETEFTQFLARHPEMALAMGTGPVALGASLRAASSEAKLNSQDGLVSKLEARAARLRDRGSEPARPERRAEVGVPVVPVDPALLAEREAALADFVAARRDLAQKQKQFTAEYPDVRQANEAAAAARERLRKVEDTIAAAKKAAAPPPAPEPEPEMGSLTPNPAARQRLSAVEKQIVQARAKVLERDPNRLLELSTQLAELDRRVSEARDRLAVIQSKQFQASLEATLDLQDKTGELVVVDPAFLPARPERRSSLKTGAAGGATAFTLAFCLSLGLVFLSDRLRAGFDLARLRLPPLLAEVPRESRRERRQVRREVVAETKLIRRPP
jgi:hypothetical protein